MRVEQSEQQLEAQVDRDLKRGTLKGVAVVFVFLVAALGFMGGVLWTAETVSQFVSQTMGGDNAAP